jgi:hypothetical protein
MEALAARPAEASSRTLSKLFSYLGGILVFSGICILIGMNWDNIHGHAPRVIVTLGTGFALFLMALATLTDKRYEGAATPLFLMSSVLQPAGIFVMLVEYGHGGDPRYGVLFMATVMLIQHAATFWSKRMTVLALTSIIFGTTLFCTLFSLMEMNGKLIGTIVGISLICIAYALNNSRHAPIAPFWYFLGSVSLLISVFDAVEKTIYEPAYLGIASLLIFLSTTARSRTLLFVSTLAVLFYIGYFTEEHITSKLGWPVSLIIGGVALIGMGSFAVRLNNKYIKQQG